MVPFKEVSKLQEACNTVGKSRDVLKGPKGIVKSGREKFSPQLERSDQAHRTVSHGQWRSKEGHLSMWASVGLSLTAVKPFFPQPLETQPGSLKWQHRHLVAAFAEIYNLRQDLKQLPNKSIQKKDVEIYKWMSVMISCDHSDQCGAFGTVLI